MQCVSRNNHVLVCANVTLPRAVVELSKPWPKIHIKADWTKVLNYNMAENIQICQKRTDLVVGYPARSRRCVSMIWQMGRKDRVASASCSIWVITFPSVALISYLVSSQWGMKLFPNRPFTCCFTVYFALAKKAYCWKATTAIPLAVYWFKYVLLSEWIRVNDGLS